MKRVVAGTCMMLSWVSTNLMAAGESSLCQQHHCVGIVDVGSSGSRLHFYAYDVDNDNNPINIEEKWSKKVKPGLSTLELQQASIDTYLNDLFSHKIDTNVPVYVYATAGMRLLSEPKQQSYYRAVATWFSKQSTWTLAEAKTISGQDEGVYGWIAANYRLGTLTQPDATPVAVMDMGGASVQISFPLDDVNAQQGGEHVRQLTLFNKSIALFSYSTLGLGQTLTLQQFLNHAHCFTQGYPLPSGEPATGDVAACQHDVVSLVNDVHHVNASVQPTLNQQSPKAWYVMGGLAYLMQNPAFHTHHGEMTGASLLAQADQALCQTPWDILQTSSEDDALYSSCFNAAYYYALVTQGYGLSPEMPIHPMPADGSDWTLGVILYQHKA